MKEKQPATVEQLVQIVQEKFSISKKEAIKYVLTLNKTGKLHFKEQVLSWTLREHLFSHKAAWYWVVLVLSIVSSVSVFILPGSVFPIAYVRYFFGSLFVLFLPGFCLLKTLFPEKRAEPVEQGVLSVGLSLIIVPLVSFFLNFTFWGITVLTLILSLAPFTLVFATIALIREYQVELK